MAIVVTALENELWWQIARPLVSSTLRVLLILGLALLVRWIAHRVVPRAVALAMWMDRVEGDLPIPAEEQAKRVETLSSVLLRTIDAILVVLGVFMLLAELGLDIAPVLAGAGIVGIAVGLGAQALVRDILAGIFILLENQFARGDVVRVAGVSGVVEAVNLRRTVLRDLDGTVHSVPNGEIRIASNLTRGWSRVNLNVSVGYDEDLDRVRAVLDRVGAALAEDPDWQALIIEPPRVLRIDAFEESGIAIKVLAKTQPMARWAVASELRRRIKATFDAEGIEIPLPHRVIVTAPESRDRADPAANSVPVAPAGATDQAVALPDTTPERDEPAALDGSPPEHDGRSSRSAE